MKVLSGDEEFLLFLEATVSVTTKTLSTSSTTAGIPTVAGGLAATFRHGSSERGDVAG